MFSALNSRTISEIYSETVSDSDMILLILARELRAIGGDAYQEFVELTSELLRIARMGGSR